MKVSAPDPCVVQGSTVFVAPNFGVSAGLRGSGVGTRFGSTETSAWGMGVGEECVYPLWKGSQTFSGRPAPRQDELPSQKNFLLNPPV